ncbi:MAG: NINE protein [Chitinophagales bacterium]
MKSKKITLVLALFTGSSGSDRFYLGQNNAGWFILLAFWVILPGLVYGVIKFNLVPNWEPFLLARFALPILFHLFAAGRYLVMSDEKFKSQDISKRKTFPLVLISLLFTGALIIGGNKILDSARVIDITTANASASLSAEQMSEEFRKDEVGYRKKYDQEVLQIEGEVSETGNDFEQGNYFALKGLNNDPFGIKCYFEAQNLKEAEMVKLGDKIVIKGVCNGNKLENCKVISVNGTKILNN